MIKTLETFLEKYDVNSCKVIIAFSGGPDSVTLAHLFKKVSTKCDIKPVLCYFNHGWRKEAKLEEEFTKNFAIELNFEYFIGRAPDNIKKNEETAREYRYNFLSNCLIKFNSRHVFLAHNKDDNVETLIYRIIKGTSVSGLCSIPEKRDNYYRPLLSVSKKEILSYLKKENLSYMIDLPNDDVTYKRNLIRKEIFPLFQKINTNFLENINNLIENSKNTQKILENKINETKAEIYSDNKIIYDKYISLSSEIRYEIINDFLFDKLKNRDRKTILKIDKFILANTDSKISINKREFLCIKNNLIYILNATNKPFNNKNSLVIANIGVYRFENKIIKIEKSERPNKFPDSSAFCCYLNITFPITVRHREKGDIFFPIGIKSKMKLKDFLINEKIDAQLKDEIILIANNTEICWVAGYKISENFKVKNKNCYKIEVKDCDE